MNLTANEKELLLHVLEAALTRLLDRARYENLRQQVAWDIGHLTRLIQKIQEEPVH